MNQWTHLVQPIAWRQQVPQSIRTEFINRLVLLAMQLVPNAQDKTVESIKRFEQGCFDRAGSYAEYQTMITNKTNELKQKVLAGMQGVPGVSGVPGAGVSGVSGMQGMRGMQGLQGLQGMQQQVQMQQLQQQHAGMGQFPVQMGYTQQQIQQLQQLQQMQMQMQMQQSHQISPQLQNGTPVMKNDVLPVNTGTSPNLLNAAVAGKSPAVTNAALGANVKTLKTAGLTDAQKIQIQNMAFYPVLQKLDSLLEKAKPEKMEAYEMILQRNMIQEQYNKVAAGTFMISPEYCKGMLDWLQGALPLVEAASIGTPKPMPQVATPSPPSSVSSPKVTLKEEYVLPDNVKAFVDADMGMTGVPHVSLVDTVFANTRSSRGKMHIKMEYHNPSDATLLYGDHVRLAQGETFHDRFEHLLEINKLTDEMNQLETIYPGIKLDSFLFNDMLSLFIHHNGKSLALRVISREYPTPGCVQLENSAEKWSSIQSCLETLL